MSFFVIIVVCNQQYKRYTTDIEAVIHKGL
jgi:hypothetical protein